MASSLPVRRFLVAASLLVLGVALAGCSTSNNAAVVIPNPSRTATRAAAAATAAARAQPFSAVVASSELAVGSNRFVLGLLDQKNEPVADATMHFRFFTLQGTQGTLRSEADARFIAPARDAGIAESVNHQHADGTQHTHVNVGSTVGVYIAQAEFAQPGNWGVEASFTTADGRKGSLNAPFQVLAKPITPAVGQKAPLTHNLTVRDTKDLTQIDSAFQPDPALHQETVADAIAAGRPALVAFLTPGYCESRFCGPEYDLVQKLKPLYGDKAALIDIEVYKDPGKRIYADAVTEWRLQSEPYLFVVDRNGVITAKFEGPTSLAELDAALKQVTS